MQNNIQVVDPHNIDVRKWDACVVNSGNCLVYGTTDYLNYTTDNWKGLVLGDYDAVMPIPWRKKFGVTYTYNVPFLQQTGIFSSTQQMKADEAIRALRSFCSYGDYFFNYGHSGVALPKMTNLVLKLDQPYATLKKQFTRDARAIIDRALGSSMQYGPGEIEEAISMYAVKGRQHLKISTRQYKNFEKLCRVLLQREQLVVRRVADGSGNALSGILLIKFQGRLYNIINSTTPEGRKQQSNYFLYHHVFREFEASDLLFDFEGSDHPGIQLFYRQFTNDDQPYFRYHFNDLPWPLRILKP